MGEIEEGVIQEEKKETKISIETEARMERLRKERFRKRFTNMEFQSVFIYLLIAIPECILDIKVQNRVYFGKNSSLKKKKEERS